MHMSPLFLTVSRMKDQSSCQESALLQNTIEGISRKINNNYRFKICIRFESFWNCWKFFTLTFNFCIHLVTDSADNVTNTLHGTHCFVHFHTPLEYSHHLHQSENTGHQQPDKLTKRPDSPDPTHIKTGKHVSPPTFAPTHGSGNERLRTDQTHVPKSQEWQSGCRHLPSGTCYSTSSLVLLASSSLRALPNLPLLSLSSLALTTSCSLCCCFHWTGGPWKGSVSRSFLHDP